MIPYVNNSFAEEVLPQIQPCTFLSQIQGMAPSTIICREFEQGTEFNRCKSVDNFQKTSIRSALIRLSCKDHKFSCLSPFSCGSSLTEGIIYIYLLSSFLDEYLIFLVVR